MDDILRSHHVMGSGRAVRVKCIDVQAALDELVIEQHQLDDADFEAVVVVHTLTRLKCAKYFQKLLKEKGEEKS